VVVVVVMGGGGGGGGSRCGCYAIQKHIKVVINIDSVYICSHFKQDMQQAICFKRLSYQHNQFSY
jgi:hypothetical protein